MIDKPKLLKALREIERIIDNDIAECGCYGGCMCSCYPVECLIEEIERGDYDR